MSVKDKIDLVEIRNFWNWFLGEKFESRIPNGLNQNQVTEIGKRVATLDSSLGWEIGPSKDKIYFFNITLNGNLDNYNIAERICAELPQSNIWSSSVGRPIKNWNWRFSISNLNQNQTIDAGEWMYLLTGFEKRSFFDLTLFGEFPELDLRAMKEVGEIVVQAALGEVERLSRIDKIYLKTLNDVDSHDKARLSPITVLGKHIKTLMGENMNPTSQPIEPTRQPIALAMPTNSLDRTKLFGN